MLSRSPISFTVGIALFATTALCVAANPFGLLHASSSVLPYSPAASIKVAQQPAVTSTLFAPNYATDLLHLRRWEKNELVIYVVNPAPVQNPEGRDYAAAMRDGTNLWNPYLRNILTVRFTSNPEEANIRVSFVNKGTLPDGAIGRTEVTYRNRDNVIVGATVRIDRSLRSGLLAQVAAHEFGHAFGMEGHSVAKTDLMYARAHLPAAITERDANTLYLNYSLEATRADATPVATAAVPDVARIGKGHTTAAACSLPGEHSH